MQKKVFSIFSDASIYARQCARDFDATVKLQREDSHWVVITDREDGCKREGQGRNHRDNGGEATNVTKQNADSRRHYLDKRINHYRSLSMSELEIIWHDREGACLELDEIAILREVIRKAKGIEPGIFVCGQCGMANGKCICGNKHDLSAKSRDSFNRGGGGLLDCCNACGRSTEYCRCGD